MTRDGFFTLGGGPVKLEPSRRARGAGYAATAKLAYSSPRPVPPASPPPSMNRTADDPPSAQTSVATVIVTRVKPEGRSSDLVEREGPMSGITILVIDDDPVFAEYSETVLQSAGMITAAISDPMALMEQLNEFRPELILMDLNVIS